MTKIYDLVHLNGHMYMVDKEATIDQDDWIIGYGEVTKANDEWCEDTHDEWKRIIATTDPSLNLPLLPQIEEYNGITKFGIPSAKKYTEEDMKEVAWNSYLFAGLQQTGESWNDWYNRKLQTLNPLPKQVEVFIEKHNIGGGFGLAHNQPLQSIEKPMVSYPQNIVQIKRWIYEDNN